MKCLNCAADLPTAEDVVVLVCPSCGWTTVTDILFPLDSNPAVVKTGPHPDDADRRIYCYSPLSKKILEDARVGRSMEVVILRLLTKGWNEIPYDDQKMLNDLLGQDPSTLRQEAETFKAKARLIEILRERVD